jgi:hypothetical protein
VPRQISLALATNVLHALPDSQDKPASGVAAELLATVDATATGSLHRCQLASEADGRSRGFPAEDWFRLVYEQAAQRLEDVLHAKDLRESRGHDRYLDHDTLMLVWLAALVAIDAPSESF